MGPTDIKFYHSGGGANCDPDDDLGGPRSSCVITGSLNNIFDDLTPFKSREGYIDYRCFYVKNTHATETFRDAKLYVFSQRKGGSSIALGYKSLDEVQSIHISGSYPPNEGELMTLEIGGYSPSINVYYHVNPTIWQGRFQTEIRGVNGLGNVRVAISGTIGFPTDIVFTVYFVNSSGNRDVSPIAVESYNLAYQTIAVAEQVKGGPVNTTATVIPNKTTAPSGITFSVPLRGSPLNLGDLLPGDQVPVWARRTTPENTTVKLLDDFQINIDGSFP